MELEKEELKKEDLIRKEAEEELDRLQRLINDFEEKYEDDKKILAYAQIQYPKKLVEWAAGEVERREVDRLKAVIRQKEEAISEFSVISEGLTKLMKQAHNRLRQADRLDKKRQIYDELKGELKESTAKEPDPSFIRDLRMYANELGAQEDCEEFLSGLST